MNPRHPDADVSEVIPTAAQQKRARQKARNNAFNSVKAALINLDDARTELAWLGADHWLEDCQASIEMVEDLKDAMEADQ